MLQGLRQTLGANNAILLLAFTSDDVDGGMTRTPGGQSAITAAQYTKATQCGARWRQIGQLDRHGAGYHGGLTVINATRDIAASNPSCREYAYEESLGRRATAHVSRASLADKLPTQLRIMSMKHNTCHQIQYNTKCEEHSPVGVVDQHNTEKT